MEMFIENHPIGTAIIVTIGATCATIAIISCGGK